MSRYNTDRSGRPERGTWQPSEQDISGAIKRAHRRYKDQGKVACDHNGALYKIERIVELYYRQVSVAIHAEKDLQSDNRPLDWDTMTRLAYEEISGEYETEYDAEQKRIAYKRDVGSWPKAD